MNAAPQGLSQGVIQSIVQHSVEPVYSDLKALKLEVGTDMFD